MNLTIHTSDKLFCSNLSPIFELSVKFVSQICHENINKPLDGAYVSDFGIDIMKFYRVSFLDPPDFHVTFGAVVTLGGFMSENKNVFYSFCNDTIHPSTN